MNTNKFLAITLIEVGNLECPNIGTIISQTGNEEELYKKAIEALESHFDAEVKSLTIQDRLRLKDVRNRDPLDAKVEIVWDGEESVWGVEVQQTFVY